MWIYDANIWASFFTLALLEIILGIDNVIFLSILSSRLPAHRQRSARMIGLSLALALRIVMLWGIVFLAQLTSAAFHLKDFAISWRDIVLGVGGLFLLYKGTREIHNTVEGHDLSPPPKTSAFLGIIGQIVVIDVVFSLDSVITAVGMTNNLGVMIAAIILAIILMLVASEPTSAFIQKHLSIKMLALSFLLLVGVALIADALHFHIPRQYLYFAIAFSLGVEALTLIAHHKRNRKDS